MLSRVVFKMIVTITVVAKQSLIIEVLLLLAFMPLKVQIVLILCHICILDKWHFQHAVKTGFLFFSHVAVFRYTVA